MKKTGLAVGGGVGILALALIVGVSNRLFAPTGFCRQCECAVSETDDAGMSKMKPYVISFGGVDTAPDAFMESLFEKACIAQARSTCKVPAGQQVADQTLEVRQCFKSERSNCEAGGMTRSMDCRACAPAKACSQTEPVRNVPRATSEFNCACAPARIDAGACREPVQYADAGPFFRDAPNSVTLAPERAIGRGCVRGLPCVELGELRTELGEGYAIPDVCKPWPGPDAGLPDVGPIE